MFKIGEEIDVFHTKAELLEKVRYYLEREDERQRIARKAHERAIRDYDVISGFAKVFDAVRSLKRRKKAVYLDNGFIRNYATFRILYISSFIRRKRFKNIFPELKEIIRLKKIDFRQAYYYILKDIWAWLSHHPVLKMKIERYLKHRVRY